MRKQNETKDLKQKINLYLDHALGAKEQDELFQKVDTDPASQQLFEAERSSRTFIKNGVKKHAVTPDFIQHIKNRLQ